MIFAVYQMQAIIDIRPHCFMKFDWLIDGVSWH